MSQLTLFINKANNNVVNKDKYWEHFNYGDDNLVNVEIVFPCSTINPTFKLGSANFSFSKCNYCYCDTLERFYYIRDIEMLNNGIVLLHCEIDPLMSFRSGIKELKCVVERIEQKKNSNGEWLVNKHLVDTQIIGRIDRQLKKIAVGKVGGNATGTHIALTTTGGV